MPEVLYRNDEHRFSVYRLYEIPDGVPRSGAADIDWWRKPHNWLHCLKWCNGKWLEVFLTRAEFGADPNRAYCCAVLDEHAGPLLTSPPAIVRPDSDAVAREASTLGAQRCEFLSLRYHDDKAWSAHLRLLVNRSEAERRAKAPSVGWDPYGED